MAYVYILQDLAGRYYIGSTDSLERRMRAHQNGHTQTTRNMKEPRLVLKQEYGTLKEARSVERRLKALKRNDYIEKIVSDGYIRVR
jgi:putative endonuclease